LREMATVDEIKAKADIVQIISERLNVKKAGKHFKALCPFHGEKTPSFMISPELQIYKCFGCGEGGDVITFLEKYEGMDFNEAIAFLSERTGIKLDPSNFQPKKEKEKIIEINSLAVKYYQYLLLKHELGKPALDYLTGKRKLTLETIQKFVIGYSPENPKIFQSFFLKKKGFNLKDLLLTGICYEKYSGLVDRFAGRIIFPLFDHRGNTVGFSGRAMPSTNPDVAKYINTPETPAYHKSDLLFGLNFAKEAIKEKEFVVVTEGELDVISPWQRGIKNIVAIKGSALTEAHTRLLSRFTKNITLALDTDFAGNAAAKRGIETAQSAGLRIKVAQFKGYKDPDEMAVSDIDGLIKCIDKAIPVYDFIINSALEKFDPNTMQGKVDISKEVVPFLAKIEDEIMKAYYIEILAKKLLVPYESVYSEVEKNKISRLTKDNEPASAKFSSGRREAIEEVLLALVLRNSPDNLVKLKRYFKSQFLKRIVERFIDFPTKPVFDIKKFSENLPAELKDRFNEMYFINLVNYEDISSEKLLLEIETLTRNLEMIDLSESQSRLIEKIRESEKEGKKAEVAKLQKKLNELVKTKMKLTGGEG